MAYQTSNNPLNLSNIEPVAKKTPVIFILAGVFVVVIVLVLVLAVILHQRSLSFTNTPPIPAKNPTLNSSTPNSSLYNFAGIITNISGNNLTVETLVGDSKLPPNVSPPKLTKVAVIVSADTEITSPIPGESSKKISLQDLKKGLRINIYTNAGINYSDPIKALKIDIIFDVPPLPLSSNSTTSANPATTK